MTDQVKIGNFLRELRKEKGLTQEELAEKLGISSKSISRWENGNTMPDLGILVELAELYDVDIKEIIDGERMGEIVEAENKTTLLKVADYAENEKKIAVKRRGLITIFTAAVIFGVLLVMLWVWGQDVGGEIGEFIYNLTHR